MWLTSACVFVVALEAAAALFNFNMTDWVTDKNTGKKYIRQSVFKLYSSEGLTRREQQKECKRRGGILPEPKNEDENDFIKKMLWKHTTWLGVTSQTNVTPRVWKWHDGTRVEWFNWGAYHFENNHNWDPVNCVFIYGGDGSWDNAQSCTTYTYDGQHFICEKGKTTVNPGKTTGKPVKPTIKPEWKTDPITGKQYIDLNKAGKPHGGNQDACIDIGAYLPEPRDLGENYFLISLKTKDFRLGMSYIKDQSVWRYDHTGSKISFSNWITNTGATGKHCAAMVQTSYFTGWARVVCSSTDATATVVCEKGIDFAANGAARKPQLAALLISVVLGLCELIHM